MAKKERSLHLQKIPNDEEIFVLRAKDMSSPKVILHWIAKNLETAPKEKLREAFECALRMMEHKSRKQAD